MASETVTIEIDNTNNSVDEGEEEQDNVAFDKEKQEEAENEQGDYYHYSAASTTASSSATRIHRQQHPEYSRYQAHNVLWQDAWLCQHSSSISLDLKKIIRYEIHQGSGGSSAAGIGSDSQTLPWFIAEDDTLAELWNKVVRGRLALLGLRVKQDYLDNFSSRRKGDDEDPNKTKACDNSRSSGNDNNQRFFSFPSHTDVRTTATTATNNKEKLLNKAHPLSLFCVLYDQLLTIANSNNYSNNNNNNHQSSQQQSRNATSTAATNPRFTIPRSPSDVRKQLVTELTASEYRDFYMGLVLESQTMGVEDYEEWITEASRCDWAHPVFLFAAAQFYGVYIHVVLSTGTQDIVHIYPISDGVGSRRPAAPSPPTSSCTGSPGAAEGGGAATTITTDQQRQQQQPPPLNGELFIAKLHEYNYISLEKDHTYNNNNHKKYLEDLEDLTLDEFRVYFKRCQDKCAAQISELNKSIFTLSNSRRLLFYKNKLTANNSNNTNGNTTAMGGNSADDPEDRLIALCDTHRANLATTFEMKKEFLSVFAFGCSSGNDHHRNNNNMDAYERTLCAVYWWSLICERYSERYLEVGNYHTAMSLSLHAILLKKFIAEWSLSATASSLRPITTSTRTPTMDQLRALVHSLSSPRRQQVLLDDYAATVRCLHFSSTAAAPLSSRSYTTATPPASSTSISTAATQFSAVSSKGNATTTATTTSTATTDEQEAMIANMVPGPEVFARLNCIILFNHQQSLSQFESLLEGPAPFPRTESPLSAAIDNNVNYNRWHGRNADDLEIIINKGLQGEDDEEEEEYQADGEQVDDNNTLAAVGDEGNIKKEDQHATLSSSSSPSSVGQDTYEDVEEDVEESPLIINPIVIHQAYLEEIYANWSTYVKACNSHLASKTFSDPHSLHDVLQYVNIAIECGAPEVFIDGNHPHLYNSLAASRASSNFMLILQRLWKLKVDLVMKYISTMCVPRSEGALSILEECLLQTLYLSTPQQQQQQQLGKSSAATADIKYNKNKTLRRAFRAALSQLDVTERDLEGLAKLRTYSKSNRKRGYIMAEEDKKRARLLDYLAHLQYQFTILRRNLQMAQQRQQTGATMDNPFQLIPGTLEHKIHLILQQRQNFEEFKNRAYLYSNANKLQSMMTPTSDINGGGGDGLATTSIGPHSKVESSFLLCEGLLQQANTAIGNLSSTNLEQHIANGDLTVQHILSRFREAKCLLHSVLDECKHIKVFSNRSHIAEDAWNMVVRVVSVLIKYETSNEAALDVLMQTLERMPPRSYLSSDHHQGGRNAGYMLLQKAFEERMQRSDPVAELQQIHQGSDRVAKEEAYEREDLDAPLTPHGDASSSAATLTEPSRGNNNVSSKREAHLAAALSNSASSVSNMHWKYYERYHAFRLALIIRDEFLPGLDDRACDNISKEICQQHDNIKWLSRHQFNHHKSSNNNKEEVCACLEAIGRIPASQQQLLRFFEILCSAYRQFTLTPEELYEQEHQHQHHQPPMASHSQHRQRNANNVVTGNSAKGFYYVEATTTTTAVTINAAVVAALKSLHAFTFTAPGGGDSDHHNTATYVLLTKHSMTLLHKLLVMLASTELPTNATTGVTTIGDRRHRSSAHHDDGGRELLLLENLVRSLAELQFDFESLKMLLAKKYHNDKRVRRMVAHATSQQPPLPRNHKSTWRHLAEENDDGEQDTEDDEQQGQQREEALAMANSFNLFPSGLIRNDDTRMRLHRMFPFIAETCYNLGRLYRAAAEYEIRASQQVDNSSNCYNGGINATVSSSSSPYQPDLMLALEYFFEGLEIVANGLEPHHQQQQSADNYEWGIGGGGAAPSSFPSTDVMMTVKLWNAFNEMMEKSMDIHTRVQFLYSLLHHYHHQHPWSSTSTHLTAAITNTISLLYVRILISTQSFNSISSGLWIPDQHHAILQLCMDILKLINENENVSTTSAAGTTTATTTTTASTGAVDTSASQLRANLLKLVLRTIRGQLDLLKSFGLHSGPEYKLSWSAMVNISMEACNIDCSKRRREYDSALEMMKALIDPRVRPLIVSRYENQRFFSKRFKSIVQRVLHIYEENPATTVNTNDAPVTSSPAFLWLDTEYKKFATVELAFKLHEENIHPDPNNKVAWSSFLCRYMHIGYILSKLAEMHKIDDQYKKAKNLSLQAVDIYHATLLSESKAIKQWHATKRYFMKQTHTNHLKHFRNERSEFEYCVLDTIARNFNNQHSALLQSIKNKNRPRTNPFDYINNGLMRATDAIHDRIRIGLFRFLVMWLLVYPLYFVWWLFWLFNKIFTLQAYGIMVTVLKVLWFLPNYFVWQLITMYSYSGRARAEGGGGETGRASSNKKKAFTSTVSTSEEANMMNTTATATATKRKQNRMTFYRILEKDFQMEHTKGEVLASIRSFMYSLIGVGYLGFCLLIWWIGCYHSDSVVWKFLSGQYQAGWYWWVPQGIEIIVMFFAIFTLSWPSAPPKVKNYYASRAKAMKEVCLIIACHKSEDMIRETLQHAMGLEWDVPFFLPEQIFIAHNGNQDLPVDNTRLVAEQVAREFNEKIGRPHTPEHSVQYTWLPIGNKTYSFYFVTKYIVPGDRYRYCMIIDDDVHLPQDLFVPTMEFKLDPHVKALAFTLRVSNIFTKRKAVKSSTGRSSTGMNSGGGGLRNLLLGHVVRQSSINWAAAFQDIEYKKAGLIKLFQSRMGTTFFAHGAVAVWERDTLVRVLRLHDGQFHGDDVQMGCILHKFNQNYRMKVVGNVPVGTIVPDHFVCRQAFWCRHSLKSLMLQRVRSWDAATHRLFFDFIKMMLFYWTRNVNILKPFLLYDVWSVVMDWARLPLLVVLLMNSPAQFGYYSAGVLLAQLLVFLPFNYWTLRDRPDLQSPFIVTLLYPLYGIFLLTVRCLGFLYAIFYWIPKTHNTPKIKEWELYDNALLREIDSEGRLLEIRKHEGGGRQARGEIDEEEENDDEHRHSTSTSNTTSSVASASSSTSTSSSSYGIAFVAHHRQARHMQQQQQQRQRHQKKKKKKYASQQQQQQRRSSEVIINMSSSPASDAATATTTNDMTKKASKQSNHHHHGRRHHYRWEYDDEDVEYGKDDNYNYDCTYAAFDDVQQQQQQQPVEDQDEEEGEEEENNYHRFTSNDSDVEEEAEEERHQKIAVQNYAVAATTTTTKDDDNNSTTTMFI